MLVQTRRIKGDIFTAKDTLEIKLDGFDKTLVQNIVHTVELVSGPNVIHGNGANCGEYLHYKSTVDADDNDLVDYEFCIMDVDQETLGDSVIKVKIKYMTNAKGKEFDDAMEAALEVTETNGTFDYPDLEDYMEYASSSEITLSWSESVFS
jgi:hypothetical protein